MKDKKVLIIGGNGFIGRNLAKILVKRNDLEVFSFDLALPREEVAGEKKLQELNIWKAIFSMILFLKMLLREWT